jgi:hypothetical protein
MARIRKGVSLRAVARKQRAKKSPPGGEGEAGHVEPLTARRLIEFPKPQAADDVVSDRMIFEVGGDRFAIRWSAEIEQLPPAAPVPVERKQKTETRSRK